MKAVTATSIISDMAFTVGFNTPDPANAVDLFTFLGMRFQNSFEGLKCASTLGLKGAEAQPIVAVRDADGIVRNLVLAPSLKELATAGAPEILASVPIPMSTMNIAAASSVTAPAPAATKAPKKKNKKF